MGVVDGMLICDRSVGCSLDPAIGGGWTKQE